MERFIEGAPEEISSPTATPQSSIDAVPYDKAKTLASGQTHVSIRRISAYSLDELQTLRDDNLGGL
jgi:hypothetical protein